MVRGEKLGDAIRYEQIENLRQDLYLYIDNNTEKIDVNLPIFLPISYLHWTGGDFLILIMQHTMNLLTVLHTG